MFLRWFSTSTTLELNFDNNAVRPKKEIQKVANPEQARDKFSREKEINKSNSRSGVWAGVLTIFAGAGVEVSSSTVEFRLSELQ